jgi:hypothetical protein
LFDGRVDPVREDRNETRIVAENGAVQVGAILDWFVCVVLSGCPHHNQYELELTPAGKSLERDLTCSRVPEKEPFPADQLAAFEQIYGQPPTLPSPGHFRFSGRFAGKTPQDIGGAGWYTVHETPLGSIAVYSERFRGNDDLAEQLDERAKAADRLSELVARWFESEMGQDPNWPKVRAFLMREFRNDVHNLSLCGWLALVNAPSSHAPPDTTENDAEPLGYLNAWIARGGQYLAERGYIEPEEIFLWVRAFTGDSDAGQWSQRIRDLFAKKTG